MEEFDLYGDLELQHAQEKEAASEDLKWKDKYAVALSTIQKLQAEKKELNKKIKQLEINFASLFDTARTEIKRKDNEILLIRKQRDDICFRRIKPQNVVRQFNENDDVRRPASREGVHVNPFSRQPIKKSEQFSDEKQKFDTAKYCKEQDLKTERDLSRDRYRDRSRDRSRHRNRSRDRLDERSRQRFKDHNETKHRGRSKDRKSSRSKERSNHRDERINDKKRKRHARNTSQSRSSDGSWNKYDKIHSDYEQTNEEKNKASSKRYERAKLEEKPRDICKSNSDHANDQSHDLKPDATENRSNSKIEILQIEILKDVKELKKNKLKADNMPKPDPIDPAKVAIEKSNQFLEALFEDSIINKSEEHNNDLYDDILLSDQQTNAVSEDNKKENHIKNDENFQTPQRPSGSKNFDDLFGPSPAGSLCSVVGRQNSIKSIGESSSDSDFVPIKKPIKSQNDEIAKTSQETVVIDGKACYEIKPPNNPVTAAINPIENNGTDKLTDDFKKTDFNVDRKKFAKTDENFNLKHQTPKKQKQTGKKLLDDLFGSSPSVSICGQENSGASMNESSSALYFEPNMKRVSNRTNEEAQEPTPSNNPIDIEDSSTDNDITNNGKNAPENIDNDSKTFRFTELDSSFYSSEDEINDDLKDKLNTSRVEVESPAFEIIRSSKNTQAFETESTKSMNNATGRSNSEEKPTISHRTDEKLLNANCVKPTNPENTEEKCEKEKLKNKIITDDFEKTCKPSFSDNQKQSKTVCGSSEQNKEVEEYCKNDDQKKRSPKKDITSYNSNSMSASEENQHRSSSSRSEKEKHHCHRHHHHHHHHHKHRSKEATHKKNDSSSHKRSRKHSRNNRQLSACHKIEAKYHFSKKKSNTIPLKSDDEPVKHISRNRKISDQDQIFFLHCDDISDDDIIIGEEYNIGSNDDGGPKMDVQNVNVIEIDFPEKNKIEINKESGESEITNEMESNKKDMGACESNDKNMNSIIPMTVENTAEINMDTECNVLSMEAKQQEKDLAHTHNLNFATETSGSKIDENPSNAVSVSVDLEKKGSTMCNLKQAANTTNKRKNNTNSGHVNDNPNISSQQLNEVNNGSEKENDFVEIQSTDKVEIETVNLDDSIEHEKSEEITSKLSKDDNITPESLNKVVLHLRSREIPNLSSLEVDSNDQQNHKIKENDQLNTSIHLSQLYNNHVELKSTTKVSNKEQSITEENDGFDVLSSDKIEKKSNDTFNNVERKSDFEQALSNKESISYEKLETSLEKDINSENASDCQMAIREPTKSSNDELVAQQSKLQNQKFCDINVHEVTSPNSKKPPVSSPNKIHVIPETKRTKEFTSQIIENIPLCSTNEPVSSSITDQNISHSNKVLSSHASPQKLPNSGDEPESSHSSSDIVSSGRRKKIKTPRKHTEVGKHVSNRTVTMVSDRHTKSDEANISIPAESESNLTSSESPSKLIPPDRDSKDANKLTHGKEPEKFIGTACSIQSSSLVLKTEPHQKKIKKKQESLDKKIKAEELNSSFENGKNIATDKMPQKEQKFVDENTSDSASKEVIYDLNKPTKSDNSLSSSFSEEQIENQGHNKEEPSLILSQTKDQQKSNCQIDEEFIETTLTPRTTTEDQFKNNENVGSDKTKNLQEQTAVLKGAEKDSPLKAVSCEANYFPPTCALNRIKDKEENKMSVESYSITIKRNKNKKKNIRNSAEVVETSPNEVVNDTNKIPCLSEILDEQIHNHDINEKHANDCDLTSNETNQHQMIKHFMDSEHMLVGTCYYHSDEVVDTKQTETNVRKRKGKSNKSPENSGSELKNKAIESSPSCEVTKFQVKRKYKKKITTSPDCSKSNEDVEVNNGRINEEPKTVSNDDENNQKKSKAVLHFKGNDSKESTKKHKPKKNNSNSSIDSTNNSNELNESMEDYEKPSSTSHLELSSFSEKNLEKVHSLQPSGLVDEVPQSSNETLNCGMEKPSSNFPKENSEETYGNTNINNAMDGCSTSIPGEEKEHEHEHTVKHKKVRKQRKRNLSPTPDTKSEEAIVQPKRSKNTPESTSQSSINTCDTTSCPASDKNHHESLEQVQRTPSHENSISIELTPTHHKIFLNDVFPNDLPPVYNANDDDLQYHEIDDRLRSMFQSPCYTQQSNGECTFDNTNDTFDSISNENVQVEKTLNESESTQFDTSTSLKKVSLGSNEYVIESIGSHTANVFITRKKSKKRTKVVKTAM